MSELPIFSVVGVGEMAEAMVRFALGAGWPRERLILTHHRADRRAELLSRYGGPVEADNVAAVRNGEVIVVAVRPQQCDALLDEIRPALRPKQLLISIAAALDLPWLERRLPAGMPVVRAVPPPASRVRTGSSFLCSNAAVSAQQRAWTEQLFEPVGKRLVWLQDRQLEAVTAIGPGITPHVVLLVDTLLKFGIEQGVPADLAREVVYEGLSAAAERIAGSGMAPDEMIRAIATPGGLTQAAVNTLEKRGVREVFRAGTLAKFARSMELRGDELPPHLQGFER